MGNVLNVYPFEDDSSSPTSNDRKTALEADGETESEGLPVKADGETESEGLPVCINKSGMDLAPIGNLCASVNENLRNCP